MQAIRAFAGRMAGGGSRIMGSAFAGASKPGGGRGLGGVAKGLSVMGSLMEFGLARQEAASLSQQARDEGMAARAEYINANEVIAGIEADYAQMVAAQRAAAPAMGIDSGSGSVVSAHEAARDEAGREIRLIENRARAGAATRRLRAYQLREAASNARFMGGLKLGVDVVGAFMPRMGGG